MTISTFVTSVTTERCYHVDRGDQIGQGDVSNQGDRLITVTSKQGNQSDRIDKGEEIIKIQGVFFNCPPPPEFAKCWPVKN